MTERKRSWTVEKHSGDPHPTLQVLWVFGGLFTVVVPAVVGVIVGCIWLINTYGWLKFLGGICVISWVTILVTVLTYRRAKRLWRVDHEFDKATGKV